MTILVTVGLITDPITFDLKNHSLITQLLKNKTEYVGNNSKVGGIIHLLTFPENIVYDYFELITDREPYGIIVHLKADTKTKELYSIEQNQQQFQKNAAIMFALIGNADYINFNLDDGKAPFSIKYTREWVNGLYGKDVRDFAKSEEEFSKLINGIFRQRAYKVHSLVYLSPVFSVTGEAFADTRRDDVYRIQEDIFNIEGKVEETSIKVINPVYRQDVVKDQLNVLGEMTLDVSKYSEKQCFHVLKSVNNCL